MATVQASTVRRAAEILGGVEVLAAQLAVRDDDVENWLENKVPTPQDIFLRCVDIVTGHDLDKITGGHAQPKGPLE
jgi:hypothetical protein